MPICKEKAMNKLTNRSNQTENSEKREETSKSATPKLQMKMVDGVVVMLAPKDEVEQSQEKAAETTIDKVQDIIVVQAEETHESEETQHVIDSESEEKSNDLARKVRAENKQRAEEAKVPSTPKKIGDSIVLESSSYNDIDKFAEKLQKDLDES